MPLYVRRARRPTKQRLHKPHWIDPYPAIPGTEPEKRVFAALVQRGIYFVYQGQIPEFERRGVFTTLEIPGYKPDFLLPEYRVIIDPFSPFHHSLPEAQEADARKYAVYVSMGYRFYFPWALADGVFVLDQGGFRLVQGRYSRAGKFRRSKSQRDRNPRKHDFDREILKAFPEFLSGRQLVGAHALLGAIPELSGPGRYKPLDPRDRRNIARGIPYRIGQFVGAGANSVAAANRRRRRPRNLTLQIRSGRGRRR